MAQPGCGLRPGRQSWCRPARGGGPGLWLAEFGVGFEGAGGAAVVSSSGARVTRRRSLTSGPESSLTRRLPARTQTVWRMNQRASCAGVR